MIRSFDFFFGRLYWGLATYGSYHVKCYLTMENQMDKTMAKLKLGLHSGVYGVEFLRSRPFLGALHGKDRSIFGYCLGLRAYRV